jgi:DNA end-binding protein Ku
MLDKKDYANIHFKRVNAVTGKEVPYENIVRAYKYNDRYVVVEESDFEQAAAEKSKVISIEDFVEEDAIDRLYYETSYYLEPEKSGSHAYKLFCEALKQSGKVGVATFVLRTREHLAVLKPEGDLLVLFRIRFPEEIRDTGELNLPKAEEVKPKELEMALSLIKSFTTEEFDISKYKDTYSQKLLDVIKAKAKGAKIIPFERKTVSQAGDLMSQLKASLAAKQKKAAS